MEQKQISSVSDRLPPLSAKFPWFVAQDLEDNTGVQIFYTMHDPLFHYRCQIPELAGRRIRGCFHGWVILSSYPDNIMWFLWNPVTSKTIHLPPLKMKDGENYDTIKYCCLASPPDDPSSILLLTRTEKPNIVFSRLDRKRKRLRWTEMTYAKQLRSITSCDDGLLHCLTCCNGKVYALNSGTCYERFVIQVDINFVNDTHVVISLLRFRKLPFPFYNGCSFMKGFLKGYCTQLFYIKVGFDHTAKNTLGAVYLFKLDMTGMIWKEMEDLNHAILFLDLANDSIYYSPAIASELGGYINILGTLDKVIYSYDIKHRTISLSYMPCLASRSYVSLWECRLQGDHREIKCRADFKPNDDKEDEIVVRLVRDDETSTRNEPHEENIVSHLLNIPFDVLEMIMEYCLGVEYLNFRATCKYCQLAAPVIRCSNKTTLRRLQTYSLVSPWLIVLDKYRGIITFTDPMFGDKYFIKTPREFIGDWRIYCSRYGWLLMFKVDERGELLFFNPFTNDILELPDAPGLDSLYFSAPPTSPDCMIFGFSTSLPWHVFIYCVTQEPSWRILPLDGAPNPHFFSFPTFYDGDIHALNRGSLGAFREMEEGAYFWDVVVAEAPKGWCSNSSAQYFLVKCDRHLLLVIVDEFGELVEVFKPNHFTKEWEKMDSLGKHMIYICGRTCLCLEAKTPEMENKVYFPRLSSEKGKIVFYSLETCMYHTFNDRNIELDLGDFIGTKYHLYPHAWIEPSWS